jgi:hypothetical protein
METRIVAKICAHIDVLREDVGPKKKRKATSSAHFLVPAPDLIAWYEDYGCAAFTNNEACVFFFPGRTPDRALQMRMGRQLIAMGFVRAQVRSYDGSRHWRYGLPPK